MSTAITKTARKTITESLRLINAVDASETITDEEVTQGLDALAAMLDTWSSSGVMINVATEVSFQLVVGTRTYTIGPTGTLVYASRPVAIDTAIIRDDTGGGDPIDYGMREMSAEEYYGIAVKDASARPLRYFWQQTATDATIKLDCKPDLAYKLVVGLLAPLTIPDDANGTIALPPGYSEVIKYNLALRLAPEYNAPVSAEVGRTADELLSNVKARYFRNPESKLPNIITRGGRRFDVRSGVYRG